MKTLLYAVVAALVVLPTPAAAGRGGEWPQTGFGAGNTYYNPDESRLNAATIGRVRPRWTLTLRKSDCETGTGPVLSGGRLFSTEPGGFGAFDPVSGRRRWDVALPGTTVRTLALADGRLLVLSSECKLPVKFQSRLAAYDPAGGAPLWSVGLTKFSYDLRVDRGMAVLDSNQDGLASTIAYRVRDGGFAWLRKGDRGDGLVSAGGRLLLRSASGGAKAVSVVSGATLWQTPLNWYAVGADPAGTRFYIDGSSGLGAVDAATGRLLWSTPRHASYVSSDGRHLYYPEYRSVECLDARTGRKLFAVHTPKAAGRSVRAGGLLYTPSGTPGSLTITDADTGTPVVAKLPSDTYYPPVVSGGFIYVRDGDLLRAFSAQ